MQRRAMAPTLAVAALAALAAIWRPRPLLACSAADLAHVPVTRRARGVHLMDQQRPRCCAKSSAQHNKRSSRLPAAAAAPTRQPEPRALRFQGEKWPPAPKPGSGRSSSRSYSAAATTSKCLSRWSKGDQ
uniref:Uncharacterized protein n=1 Tax=Arundo donax TaxID=35708 RepID=A0A0A9GJM9_ARUDO